MFRTRGEALLIAGDLPLARSVHQEPARQGLSRLQGPGRLQKGVNNQLGRSGLSGHKQEKGEEEKEGEGGIKKRQKTTQIIFFKHLKIFLYKNMSFIKYAYKCNYICKIHTGYITVKQSSYYF